MATSDDIMFIETVPTVPTGIPVTQAQFNAAYEQVKRATEQLKQHSLALAQSANVNRKIYMRLQAEMKQMQHQNRANLSKLSKSPVLHLDITSDDSKQPSTFITSSFTPQLINEITSSDEADDEQDVQDPNFHPDMPDWYKSVSQTVAVLRIHNQRNKDPKLKAKVPNNKIMFTKNLQFYIDQANKIIEKCGMEYWNELISVRKSIVKRFNTMYANAKKQQATNSPQTTLSDDSDSTMMQPEEKVEKEEENDKPAPVEAIVLQTKPSKVDEQSKPVEIVNEFEALSKEIHLLDTSIPVAPYDPRWVMTPQVFKHESHFYDSMMLESMGIILLRFDTTHVLTKLFYGVSKEQLVDFYATECKLGLDRVCVFSATCPPVNCLTGRGMFRLIAYFYNELTSKDIDEFMAVAKKLTYSFGDLSQLI